MQRIRVRRRGCYLMAIPKKNTCMAVDRDNNFEGTFAVADGSKDLILDIAIGDGQQDSAVSIFLGPASQGRALHTNLGRANDAKGKTLTIVVVIQDRMNETNWTSCTMVLTSGGQKITYGPFSKEAVNNLDTIIYTLKISIS